MPKQTTVVEFEDKEIRDILLARAKEALGKAIQGSSEVAFVGGTDAKGVLNSGPIDRLSCRITFNGKAG